MGFDVSFNWETEVRDPTQSGGAKPPSGGGGLTMGGGLAALASLTATAYSFYKQQEAQEDATKLQRLALREQEKSKAQQAAMNASKAARETRAQIREERVRRARILQSSINTGVEGSSGEIGAVGGLATQLGSNLGFMKGQFAGAQNITNLEQNAANLLSSSQNKINSANQWGQVGGLGMSIFDASGGFNSLGSLFSSDTTQANKTSDPIGAMNSLRKWT